MAQGFIEIVILPGLEPHIVEQLGRQDIEPLFPDRLGTSVFRILIAQQRVVELFIPRTAFLSIQVIGQVFREKTVKQHTQHITLEIPAIHTATQIIGNAPDGLVQLSPFNLFGIAHEIFLSVCFPPAAP